MTKANIVTACMVAIVIGSLLNIINSFEVIMGQASLTTGKIIKIALTYMTPFFVSLYSSVKATRKLKIEKIR
jgi:hypothetical protein